MALKSIFFFLMPASVFSQNVDVYLSLSHLTERRLEGAKEKITNLKWDTAQDARDVFELLEEYNRQVAIANKLIWRLKSRYSKLDKGERTIQGLKTPGSLSENFDQSLNESFIFSVQKILPSLEARAAYFHEFTVKTIKSFNRVDSGERRPWLASILLRLGVWDETIIVEAITVLSAAEVEGLVQRDLEWLPLEVWEKNLDALSEHWAIPYQTLVKERLAHESERIAAFAEAILRQLEHGDAELTDFQAKLFRAVQVDHPALFDDLAGSTLSDLQRIVLIKYLNQSRSAWPETTIQLLHDISLPRLSESLTKSLVVYMNSFSLARVADAESIEESSALLLETFSLRGELGLSSSASLALIGRWLHTNNYQDLMAELALQLADLPAVLSRVTYVRQVCQSHFEPLLVFFDELGDERWPRLVWSAEKLDCSFPHVLDRVLRGEA